MPSSLDKTRKQIAKKRNGTIEALHQNSRDSKRLHRAQVRDDRLDKIAAARRKQNQPLLDRTAHFQHAVREGGGKPLQLEAVQTLIKAFIHQYDSELEALKKARRPGRPASTREDLLKMKVSALNKEYTDGFFIPDLSTKENLSLLDRWEGSWSYLTTLIWVKITDSGKELPSNFPPMQG
ncbi:hypothetical protein NKR23_g4777 [Pleurostoma richardsiae]|uniref:Translation machinery-associated protein 16 n=1 Tax=Pleurostoma richardsiae TaxID=41990 RepID=A0AA38VUM9_9PEZI|nr:hypothetical protein NKR23_g4777 [Pleurostoma richardsiae]